MLNIQDLNAGFISVLTPLTRLIRMRIRYKMLLILGLITVILMAGLIVFGEKAMLDGITESENKQSTDNALRLTQNIDIAITNIHNTVNDWAQWDDTYTFVENKNTGYIVSNLVDDTFVNLQLNMMLYFNKEGSLVFGKLYNYSEQTVIQLNDNTIAQVKQNKNLFNETAQEGGLILLDGTPMMVASCPILSSLEEGPSHGTLIMGRYLDENQLMLLSSSTGLPISYALVNSTSASARFELAKANLSGERPIFAHPLNETYIAGYVLLSDVEGEPLLIMRVDDYRTEYTLGTGGLVYSEIFFVGIALCVFIAIALLLDKLVISRLSSLSDTVTKIRHNDKNLRRVKVEGNDELSRLSQNINGMLDVIEKNTFTLENTVAERTKELAENKKHLEGILQASPDAIIAADLNGNLIECNTRVIELSGFSREELIGKSGLTFLAERFRENFVSEVALVLQNKGPVRSETYFMKKDGFEIPVEFSVSLVKDEADHPIGIVGIIRDLSEKKLLEQRLLRSERLAAIGELAGMVAHDIRNPLAAIRNADYLIKKKTVNGKNSDIAPMIEIIDKSIEHANAIITDLLEYSKKLRLDIVECSPKQLLEKALIMVKIPENIQFQDLTADSKLKVDENKAVRVYVNLIKNAVDAMPTGGRLEIKSYLEKDTVVISFTDTGQGISQETLPKIFTPLFTTKAQGMGFGLSISKRIVEGHGGKILVQSEEGKGTTFIVIFPLEPKFNDEESGGNPDILTDEIV